MRLSLIAAACLIATTAHSQGYVNPYVRQNGTVVQGYHRTAPDSNPYNNYTTQGNVNPYTGQAGTRDPYQVQQQYQSAPVRQQQCSFNSMGQYVCR